MFVRIKLIRIFRPDIIALARQKKTDDDAELFLLGPKNRLSQENCPCGGRHEVEKIPFDLTKEETHDQWLNIKSGIRNNTFYGIAVFVDDDLEIHPNSTSSPFDADWQCVKCGKVDRMCSNFVRSGLSFRREAIEIERKNWNGNAVEQMH